MSDWQEEYIKTLQYTPKEGDILTSIDGKDIKLDIDLEDGKPPFVYGRAYVPNLVGCDLGWFIHSIDSEQNHGLKCILLPNAREHLLKSRGHERPLRAKSLKVNRWTTSGKAILCEINEL